MVRAILYIFAGASLVLLLVTVFLWARGGAVSDGLIYERVTWQPVNDRLTRRIISHTMIGCAESKLVINILTEVRTPQRLSAQVQQVRQPAGRHFKRAHTTFCVMLQSSGNDWYGLSYRSSRGGYDTPATGYQCWNLHTIATAPMWLITGSQAALPLLALAMIRRRKQRFGAGRCTHCGYDLRASAGRCPECGTVSARGEPGNARQVPATAEVFGRNGIKVLP